MMSTTNLHSLWLVIGLFLSMQGFSQKSAPTNVSEAAKVGKVTGKIIDAETNLPIDYANIVVFRVKDSVMISGAVTNPKGDFEVAQLPSGKFYLRISFIGYQDLLSEPFTLLPKVPEKNIGTLALHSSAKNLGAVEIVAEKRLVEYSLDRRVVNVDKNIVNEGGNALDVLQNVPSINVDADGNVSMKGSTSVTLLIDGRPANISGVSLDQLPANLIENVEIISNPSAKFNPEGMAGIINIKTKKSKQSGLNGVANLSVSTANRNNASLNLNYNTGKFSFFTTIGGRYNQGGMTGSSVKTGTSLSDTVYPFYREESSFDNDRNSKGANIKFGTTYTINKKNSVTLGASYDYSAFNMDNNTPGTNRLIYNDPNDLHWVQTVMNNSQAQNKFTDWGLNLGYKHTFDKPREELTLDMSYQEGLNDRNQQIQRTILNIMDTSLSPQENTTLGDDYDFDAQLNYVYPLREKGKIEMGYQGKMRGGDNDNKQYVQDEEGNMTQSFDLSSRFINHEQVHGMYASWGDEFGKYTFQVGGRLEYAFMDGKTLVPQGSANHDTAFDYHYLRFYPTIHLSRKIGNTQELQLSYSRRVNRPRAWSLNPFVDYSNYPISIRYGNPELLPEDIHSLELNHAKYWKKTSLYTTLYYRQINDVIRQYTFMAIDDRGNEVQNNTSYNYASGNNYGVDMIVEQELYKWWRLNLSGSFYHNSTKGGGDESINSEGYSYSFKFNSNMNFPKNLTIQLSAQYRGPQFNGQNEMDESFFADLALRKGFYNNKLTVGLRLSDIFNTMNFNSTTHGENFTINSSSKRKHTQAIVLSLSYKINQGVRQQNNKKPAENTNHEEEMF